MAERRLCRTRCWRIGRSTVSTVTAFMRRIPKSSGFGRYTHTHTCTHAHMHTCTHTHTYTLHYTHTHIHTPQALAAMSPSARADVWRFATGSCMPPTRCEGGCGAMEVYTYIIHTYIHTHTCGCTWCMRMYLHTYMLTYAYIYIHTRV